ncbi:MAG: MBL fold metallo-hydrolase [Acidobacteria bacterium]|nr:MBL fold metallo-hydrolase [Acidobacteriota bacterium]
MVTRRTFLTASSATLAWTALRPSFGLAQEFETSFVDLRGGVGIFNGRGGTIGWYVAPEAVVVVDSQFPDSAKVCLSGLESRTSRKIDLLVNSHHHGDHTAGNVVFRPAVQKIVAHARAVELHRQTAEKANTVGAQAFADTTFTDVWEQPVGKERLRLRYYGPAHTGGDAVITFLEANVVHMGDLVFNRRHPFIDRPGGASIAGWITLLERTADDHPTDTRYIFGHGSSNAGVTGGRADVLKQRDYLTALLDFARKQMAAGKTRDDLGAFDVLPGFEDYQGSGANLQLGRCLQTAYDELSAG